MYFDPELVVTDPDLCLREGAIDPWERRNSAFFQQVLDAVAAAFDIDLYKPWNKLPAEQRQLILEGSAGKEIAFAFEKNGRKHTFKKEFEGVLANLQRRFDEYQRRRREQGRNTDEDFEAVYDEFHRYMSHSPCAECGGTRLRKEARHVRVGGKSIVEVCALTVGQVHEFIRDLAALPARLAGLPPHRARGDGAPLLPGQRRRRLPLARPPAATLSGGEGQRIRLATQIGSGLQGVLYILDEPSIGLHQRDNARLIETLVKLRDLGNTVLVVEHDEDTIRAADYVIDMGPRAGELGGRVVAAGTPAQIEKDPQSLTGAYLSGREGHRRPQAPPAGQPAQPHPARGPHPQPAQPQPVVSRSACSPA